MSPSPGQMSGLMAHHFPKHWCISPGFPLSFQENQDLAYLRAFAQAGPCIWDVFLNCVLHLSNSYSSFRSPFRNSFVREAWSTSLTWVEPSILSSHFPVHLIYLIIFICFPTRLKFEEIGNVDKQEASLFTYSFNKYWASTYYMPVFSEQKTLVCSKRKNSCSHGICILIFSYSWTANTVQKHH